MNVYDSNRLPIRRYNVPILLCWALAQIASVGSCLSSSPVVASPFKNDMVTVTIKTIDNKGNPIPWVTIGSVWSPYPSLKQSTTHWPRLQPKDLKRLLFRNPEAWEYWNNFNSPVMYLHFSGLTDQRGVLKDEIDYVDAAGKGSEWPDELTVTYGAYRYGLHPTTGQIKIRRGDREVDLALVVEPDSTYTARLPDYLRTFYEIRHALADWRRNEDVSLENHERLENYRKQLSEAAESAAARGDRRAAAAIMYWIAYVPEVNVVAGKAVGFAQTRESLRNYEALRKAADYDPDNPHIQAQAMLYEIWWWNRENDAGRITYNEMKQLRRQWLERATALDKRSGTRLWAKFHEEIADTYGFFGMRVEQVGKLEWLETYDPSWSTDLPDRIERIKRRM